MQNTSPDNGKIEDDFLVLLFHSKCTLPEVSMSIVHEPLVGTFLMVSLEWPWAEIKRFSLSRLCLYKSNTTEMLNWTLRHRQQKPWQKKSTVIPIAKMAFLCDSSANLASSWRGQWYLDQAPAWSIFLICKKEHLSHTCLPAEFIKGLEWCHEVKMAISSFSSSFIFLQSVDLPLSDLLQAHITLFNLLGACHDVFILEFLTELPPSRVFWLLLEYRN